MPESNRVEQSGNGQPSDEELVRRAQSAPGTPEGRQAAEALLMRWRERLYLWCHWRVRDHERAMDLTQECLVRAYRGLPAFESRSAVSSWLFAIARNCCLSAMRKRPLRHDPDVDLEDMTDLLAGPEETAEHRVRLERVLGAMNEVLEPVERQALWLRAHEGLHVDEITHLLGLDGASGARNVLQTARRKLRQALGPDGPGEENP
jgi:RNA polymerase sigma-70 factor, ECF subfamily